MRHKRDTSKKRVAETVGGYVVPALLDAEDESLRVEFLSLDLTEAEQGDLAQAWRLRRRGAPSADLRASRAMFDRVRLSLAEALATTIRQETKPDELIRALAVFDREEAVRRERLEVALMRPCANEQAAVLRARLNALDATVRDRRQELADTVAMGGKVSTMPNSGAHRIHSRDGLGTLFEAKRLTSRQFNAGRAYRLRYEAVSRGLRSCLGSSGGGGSLTPEQIAEAQARLAKWERERIRAELAVARRISPLGLRLVRQVAGEGVAITSIVGSGRANKAGIDTLARALDVCSPLLPQYA